MQQALASSTVTISAIPNRDPINVEVILIQSASKKHPSIGSSSPLIVLPHGGPHSALTTGYSLNVAAFVALGFSVLLVNYTGSLGFGEQSVSALLGHIGSLDIEDVHQASLWASQQPGIDASRVVLFGGSHGGFITAHLIAKYPDFYKSGALRNPVINVGAMVSDTDIPDWCFAEAKMPFSIYQPHFLSPKEYADMYAISPVGQIKARISPALLMLGANDRRVPPSQGKRWAEYLQGQGHAIQTLLFPGTGHALDSFDAERYAFESAVAFFCQHF